MFPTTLVVLALVASSFGAPSKQFLQTSVHHSRIIGGNDAEVGANPHQISYQWGLLGLDQHVCGGSILSPTWVVTAGHCVTQVPAFGDFKVVAGITNLDDTNPERQVVNVVEKIVHPDFGGNVGPNDIALLRLETPLELNDLVQPIALPEADSEPEGNVTLTGWGVVVDDPLFPTLPNTLQTIDLPLLSLTECREAIDELLDGAIEDPLDDVSNVCTGPLTGEVSACSGDSGGPLTQNGTLVGIVSWGFTPCATVGAPSVYTNVIAFLDFINEHVTDLA